MTHRKKKYDYPEAILRDALQETSRHTAPTATDSSSPYVMVAYRYTTPLSKHNWKTPPYYPTTTPQLQLRALGDPLVFSEKNYLCLPHSVTLG
tara:strand:- start:167 stop:445 length:279 start_codon:yes stop_codon:yes gene_type:complete